MDADFAKALGDLLTTLFVEGAVVVLLVLYVVSRKNGGRQW